MFKVWWFFPVLALLGACVQTPPETASPARQDTLKPVRSGAVSRRSYRYQVEGSSQMAGFSLMINGTVLLSSDGGREQHFQTPINDWMISGNNEIAVDLFWPDGVKFTSGTSALFRLMVNDTLVKEFRWPLANVPDTLTVNPYTFREIFRADSFPRVQMERAEQVISHAGSLSRDDQQEIAALAEELRRAFAEKNISAVNGLLKTKYADLALARFTTQAAMEAEANDAYRTLMERDAYTARPLNGRYSYSSVADGRAVRLSQGRVGFPEPALILTYRENNKTVRYEQELYFAKIDARWVIIR